MYWPKFNQRKLMKKLRDRKRTSGGVSCFYVQWTKKVGLKVYRSCRERNNVMRRQRRAAEHGLGPRVGSPVDFEVCQVGWNDPPSMRPLKLYAYFTEHVKVARRYYPKKTFDKLDCDLQKIGIFTYDLHANNVARRGRKLVCIDFGSEGCGLGRPKKHPIPNRNNCSDDFNAWDDCSS